MLTAISGSPTRVPKGKDLVSEGVKTSQVHIILDGLACCYKITNSGKRQIFSYLVAGDSCDLHAALLDKSDFGVRLITDCVVAKIDHGSILDITAKQPAIARAFWCSSLVDAAILQEWLTGLGQRTADRRIAHLFCELHARLRAVGLASDGDFQLDISQAELADTIGLSAVHVNRSLQRLSRDGWATFSHRQVHIHNVHRLAEYADFDAGYLHLNEMCLSPALALT